MTFDGGQAEVMLTWPWMITLRRLTSADTGHLTNLSDESAWISKTWGGPAGLAASGYAWGAFAGDQLAAVANVFFVGNTYEESRNSTF